MEQPAKIFLALSIFLIIGVSMTGCSDSSDTGDSTSGTGVATTTAGPLFTTGDIVRSSTGSTSTGWLVIDYDAASDSYTRAFIYQNPDGTWGYRVNANTETSPRSVMEKVYTVKITHVAVASVPTGAPTTVTTIPTTTATRSVTTSAATATTTSSSASRPAIKTMDPEEGEAGTTVSTEITGSDFISNLTARLRRSGETGITATTCTFHSSSSVTCSFDIPATAKVGAWDIVLTNPNSLSGEIANYFMVRGNATAY
jgi:hypothetical protein